MELNKNTRKWILVLVAISLGMVWVMQRLEFIPHFLGLVISFLSPLLIGVMIAFIVNMPMRWLETKVFGRIFKKSPKLRKLSRPLSMIIAFLLVIGVVGAIIFMLVPDLVRTLISFAQQLPTAFNNLQNWIDELGTSDSELSLFLNNSNLSLQSLIMRVSNWINNTVTEIFSSAFSWITGLVNGFVNFFLGVVFAIYFLMQKERLGRQIKQVAYAALPESLVDRALQLGKLVNTVFSRFLGGQGLEALILGSLVFIFMHIFSFPYPLTISVLVAIGALIPVFGATIGGVFGALLIVVDNPIQALWFMIMLISIQQVEGNFIYPRVVGKSVGLPSVWVLLAVTFGLKLFGFFGLLIGVPLFSVFYILIRSWSWRRVKEKEIGSEKLRYNTASHDPEALVKPLRRPEHEPSAEKPKPEKESGLRNIRRMISHPEEEELSLIDEAAENWQAARGKEPPEYAAEMPQKAPLKHAASQPEPRPAPRQEPGSVPADPENKVKYRPLSEPPKAAGKPADRDESLKKARPDPVSESEEDKAHPSPRVRSFKGGFDFDRLERDLEREAEEASEIRRRARMGKNKNKEK